MKLNYTIFIVEGELFDTKIIKELNELYLQMDMEVMIYKTNLYSLYKTLADDDFDTDVIEIMREKQIDADFLNSVENSEILREDISQIYLFFDLDAHHYSENNSEKTIEIINELLTHFDNETENGKLYLSYPMIESLHHRVDSDLSENSALLRTFYCFEGKDKSGKHYKKVSAVNKTIKVTPASNSYTEEMWEEAFYYYIIASLSLFDKKMFLEYIEYQEMVNSFTIFEKQLIKYIKENKRILVINGYPQFIIDYLGEVFYNDIIGQKKFPDKIRIEHIQ